MNPLAPIMAACAQLAGSIASFGRSVGKTQSVASNLPPSVLRALEPLVLHRNAAKARYAASRIRRADRIRAKRRRTNLARTKNRSAKSQLRGNIMRSYLNNRRHKATPSDMREAVSLANYWLKQTV